MNSLFYMNNSFYVIELKKIVPRHFQAGFLAGFSFFSKYPMTTHSEPSSQSSSSAQSSPILKKEGRTQLFEFSVSLDDSTITKDVNMAPTKRETDSMPLGHVKLDPIALPPLLKKKRQEPLVFRPFSSFSALELTVKSLNLYLSNTMTERK